MAPEVVAASGGTLALGALAASVRVAQGDDALTREMDLALERLAGAPAAWVAAQPEVQALRRTYRALGKDPTRYRGSSEALLRRAVRGQGLYRVNSVVDVNNLVSIESRRPLGSYDRARIGDAVTLRAGRAGERYDAIGKGAINAEGLPLLADEHGPFGGPTSDSTRAMITPQTDTVLVVVYAFDGAEGLIEQIDRAAALLEAHAGADAFERRTILPEDAT